MKNTKFFAVNGNITDVELTDCKYPNIHVQLVGEDGNAFAILGAVTKALRKGGVESTEIDKFHAEATSGDYDHLLATCMKWVEVD